MGSSKRHKSDKSRDPKRKRHRSRSRSRSYTPERDRSEKHKHHKKHKKKDRKDYDSDVEIIESSFPLPVKPSKTVYNQAPVPVPTSSHRHSPPPTNKSEQSLSIEETNKLRAKLGLKPLDVSSASNDNRDNYKEKRDGNFIKDDLGEFYHKPATNIADKEKTEKIKERLSTFKQKRTIENSLNAIKTLGQSDSDDDTTNWVNKSRKIEDEKRKAEERAKLLDQMDEEFGVSNLVNEEVQLERRKAYTDRDLRGLRVEHDLDNIGEGAIILTLKDQPVLAKDADTLVNVNLLDNERYKKNILNKTKKPGYDAYDDDNFDEYGMAKHSILKKYDDEIVGEKRESFTIGLTDPRLIKERQAKLVKERLANKRIESLELPELKLANDYYNEEELVKFKKPKKKIRKIRKNKMLKADDIIPDEKDYLRDLGSRRRRRDDINSNTSNHIMDTNDIDGPSEDLSGFKIEDDFDLDDKISQKTKKLKRPVQPVKIENIALTIKQENERLDSNDHSGAITLNSMAEFCRTLGDIPTYGQAGNREDNEEFMDFEVNEYKRETIDDEDFINERGAWNQVRMDDIPETMATEAAILDAEPSLDQGVGGALKLAMSKGYLQKEDDKRPSASRFAHLKAKNYSIEDKAHNDDDKFGRRDRFNGPSMDFKEKEGYKPNVKLEYIDDDGHVLNAKEAFRYLSHKFHGKGPGKNKVEKRMKKAEQESLMKRMSSTDTPLGTLTLLQAKQKDTQSPFIVLSGSKQLQTASISKSKN